MVVWRPIQYAMASHRRVLVVDDYREAADALQMLLNADGFECRALDDPHAVCDMASEWQPFAVVLDIKMPESTASNLRGACARIHRRRICCWLRAPRSPRATTAPARAPWVSTRIARNR